MSLRSVLQRAVNVAFNVFNEAVKSGTYIVETDDGFTAPSEEVDDVRVILDKWSQEDISSSIYPLVQPTDVKALIPGEDLNLQMNTANILSVGERKFTIIAFETDPYEILYTLLVRDTK